MKPRTHLLIIDPQNDFCARQGSLSVPGADEDMNRLATLIGRLGDSLTGIHVTLDSHRRVDISHPLWWRDTDGNEPAPYTAITPDELRSGRWRCAQSSTRDRTLAYLEALEVSGRYPHVVWPYHCLIGDAGHNVWPTLAESIHEWEERFAWPDFVIKGLNPWTEHFSAVRAEVPDPDDAATQVNQTLVHALEEADLVLVAGEALSHCVANTVRDLASHFTDPGHLERLVLLTDATSTVPGYENCAAGFISDLTAKGMKLATTTTLPR